MPRTLAQNATYINETIKPAIKSAIEAQGVTVPSTDSFLDYADRIAEIEGGGSGYQLKDLPTGAISTVNDAAELPLNALKVSVEAWQEGSGDPSPSNVRPIHGWDSGEIGVIGKNWLPKQEQGTTTIAGITYEVRTDGSIYVHGTAESQLDFALAVTNSFELQVGNYTIKRPPEGMQMVIGGANNTSGLPYKAVFASADVTFEISKKGTIGYCLLRILNGNTVDDVVYPQIELGTQSTSFEPYQGKQYTQQFPTTIYGAEWDVVSGELKQTDGYIASYNGEALPSTWISDRDVYASGTTPTIGAEVVYKLATPTTIDLSPLSIRLLEGSNNVYADCGEVLEGEYFVDEGAIDVRKVDYSIGSNSTLKISDGRILQGFASMTSYHARPLDASGNWLDVDWSKDFEIGVAFKLTSLPTYQFLFGCGLTTNDRFKQPRLFYDNSTQTVELNISTDGSSWESITLTNNSIVANKWYFVKIKFTLSTLKLIASISEDLSTFATMCDETLSGAVYHNSASLSIGGDTNNSAMTSNDCLIDTFNTYVKGDGVNWGAFTGAFPS